MSITPWVRVETVISTVSANQRCSTLPVQRDCVAAVGQVQAVGACAQIEGGARRYSSTHGDRVRTGTADQAFNRAVQRERGSATQRLIGRLLPRG